MLWLICFFMAAFAADSHLYWKLVTIQQSSISRQILLLTLRTRQLVPSEETVAGYRNHWTACSGAWPRAWDILTVNTEDDDHWSLPDVCHREGITANICFSESNNNENISRLRERVTQTHQTLTYLAHRFQLPGLSRTWGIPINIRSSNSSSLFDEILESYFELSTAVFHRLSISTATFEDHSCFHTQTLIAMHQPCSRLLTRILQDISKATSSIEHSEDPSVRKLTSSSTLSSVHRVLLEALQLNEKKRFLKRRSQSNFLDNSNTKRQESSLEDLSVLLVRAGSFRQIQFDQWDCTDIQHRTESIMNWASILCQERQQHAKNNERQWKAEETIIRFVLEDEQLIQTLVSTFHNNSRGSIHHQLTTHHRVGIRENAFQLNASLVNPAGWRNGQLQLTIQVVANNDSDNSISEESIVSVSTTKSALMDLFIRWPHPFGNPSLHQLTTTINPLNTSIRQVDDWQILNLWESKGSGQLEFYLRLHLTFSPNIPSHVFQFNIPFRGFTGHYYHSSPEIATDILFPNIIGQLHWITNQSTSHWKQISSIPLQDSLSSANVWSVDTSHVTSVRHPTDHVFPLLAATLTVSAFLWVILVRLTLRS